MLKAIFLTTSTIKMRTCGCEHIQISFPKYAKFNSFPEHDKNHSNGYALYLHLQIYTVLNE